MGMEGAVLEAGVPSGVPSWRVPNGWAVRSLEEYIPCGLCGCCRKFGLKFENMYFGLDRFQVFAGGQEGIEIT